MKIKDIIGLILMILGSALIGTFLGVNEVLFNFKNYIWFMGSLALILIGFLLWCCPFVRNKKAKTMEDFIMYKDGKYKIGDRII